MIINYVKKATFALILVLMLTVLFAVFAVNGGSYPQGVSHGLTADKLDVNLTLEAKNATYSTNGTNAIAVSANTAIAKDNNDDLMPAQTMIYEYSKDAETWSDIAPSNAGSYDVRVTYTISDATSDYQTTTTIFEDAVVIAQYDLGATIAMDAYITTYTGSNAVPQGTFGGLEGGSAPTGYLSYEYRLASGTEISAEAKNVGTYDVFVSYVSGTDDNYCSSTILTVEDGIKIEQAEVNMNMKKYDMNYSGNNVSIEVTASGVGDGDDPQGNILYGYALANYDIPSEDYVTGIFWSTQKPVNAGEYFVMASYTNVAGENYKYTVVVFTDNLVINKVEPTIAIKTVTSQYTGEAITANATAKGIAGDELHGTISYLYGVDSKDWSADAPTASGEYDVRVIYTVADADNNYKSSDKVFTKAVIIKNIAPVISIDSNVAYTYSGVSYTIGDITISNVVNDGDALGRFNVEYQLDGTSIWKTTEPTEAGDYNARVTYSSAVVDNFASGVAIFSKALTINKLGVEVTPIAEQSKVYDGLAIDGATIRCDLPELAEGNTYSGSVTATTGVNVGNYPISIGTLSAGNNYTISFVEGVEYSIIQKDLLLSFSTINSVYDGIAKEVSVTIDNTSVVGEDEVAITYSTVGDVINVGSFEVQAVLSETGDYANYKLQAIDSKIYKITPATMTQNVFTNANAVYDGLEHTITLSQIEEGAVVVYDNATCYIARGSYTVTATISKANYETVVLSATLVITKGEPTVTVATVEQDFVYGDSLPKLVVTGLAGKATLDQGQKLAVGTKLYTWTFVPEDTANYNNCTGNVTITVAKAKVNIAISGALKQTTSNPKNIHVTVNGLDNATNLSASVYYVNDMTGEVSTVKPNKEGTYTVKVVYAEDANYAETVVTSKMFITKETNLNWILGVIAVIVILGAGSAIYFARRNYKNR